MRQFQFDFAVIDDDGRERLFNFIVLCESPEESQQLWNDLLDVLPAGRVGGGVYEVQDEQQA